MRLVLHREIPEDDRLACQWNALVLQMECPEVFYTYQWALAVSRAYSSSVAPLLILAYDQDSLVGVVALATDSLRRGTFFLNSTTADYCDFISSPANRADFVGLVFRELRRLRIPALVAANLPADSVTSGIFPEATGPLGYRAFFRPASRCSQITMGSSVERRNLRDVVANRKALRYSLKSLERHGPLSIDHLKSAENLQTALPEFMRAHIARFSATGRRSNLAHPERQMFLIELAGLLSTAGWIVLSRLRVGDDSVAWNYGFKFSGSWFYYQPTFNSDWRKFSPGFCLLSKIVESACDDPAIERVDLGLGAEGYKERFATGIRQTLDVTVTASTTHYLREAARYHVATAIKSSPRLEHGVRRMLGRVPVGGGQG
ncbi:MAG TPA: GNAT family N-acetyltransferase [Terriglobales bacterium]|nr:GNAT family N-acetyltransferase [Terriglobales bacterium]